MGALLVVLLSCPSSSFMAQVEQSKIARGCTVPAGGPWRLYKEAAHLRIAEEFGRARSMILELRGTVSDLRGDRDGLLRTHLGATLALRDALKEANQSLADVTGRLVEANAEVRDLRRRTEDLRGDWWWWGSWGIVAGAAIVVVVHATTGG